MKAVKGSTPYITGSRSTMANWQWIHSRTTEIHGDFSQIQTFMRGWLRALMPPCSVAGVRIHVTPAFIASEAARHLTLESRDFITIDYCGSILHSTPNALVFADVNKVLVYYACISPSKTVAGTVAASVNPSTLASLE